MRYYATAISAYDKNRLQHFGIKGQKWGIRRFQNEDGSLTDAGKQRYGKDLREVEKNLDLAKMETAKYRRKVDRDNARILLPTLFPRHHKKQLKRANKKEAEIESVYENLKKHDEEQARKRFEEDEKLSSLSKRMDSFDKTKSADEKFAILDEVIKASNEMYRNGDKEGSSRLMDFWWDNKNKAGEARIHEYESLPHGKERDQKLTQLLKDSSQEGQDSEYVNGLINRMQAKHGDYLSRNFKTEAARKAAEEADAAMDEETRIGDLYYKQDQKLGKYKKDPYGSSFFVLDKLAADHPEVKQAMDNRESKWEKYCEQVLKDMDMPVNEDTLHAIMAVIIWN